MVLNRQAGSLVAGILLMGLGGLFLVAQLLGGNFWANFWPFPIIGVGLAFLYAMMTGGRGASGLAIPGSIITTVGILLLLQNSFDWWESWAFAWTFIIIALGVGIFLMGLRNQDEKTQRRGLMIAAIGFVLFIPFGTFFGLGFSFLGFSFATRMIWPLILIGVGVVLALRGVVAISQDSSSTNREPAIPESQSTTTPKEPA